MFDNVKVKEILAYLKVKGERHDTEIAQEVGMTLSRTRAYLDDLAENGELVSCRSIKFIKSKKVEGFSWRLAGVLPSFSPGRKSKSHLKAG